MKKAEILNPEYNENYYRYLNPFKYLNHILEKGVYYKSFCLFPERITFTWMSNFNKIKNKYFNLIFNIEFMNVYKNNKHIV